MELAPLSGCTVLVVDDQDAMRRLIGKNLAEIGCRTVLQANNGRDALNILEQRDGIDALVTDWNMPLMSGIELLRAVRDHPRLAKLPVLMVTGEMSRPQVEEAIAAGVSNFLVKPFTVGSLQTRLLHILGRSPAAAARPAQAEAEQLRAAADAVPVLSLPWPHSASAQQAADSAPCVLVVDDAPQNIDVLVGLLRADYRVLAATGGAEALRLLEQAQPELILLDVVMPGMGGYEVLARLKAEPRWADIPVIFLTAEDADAQIVEGLQAGAVDYITKPVEPRVLRARVQGQVARRQALYALQRQLDVEIENARLREEVERISRHDLKSPIGGIINFSEALLHEADLPADQLELVCAIHDSAWSVLNLINLSLDLYRIERGSYHLQAVPVDLFQLIRRILKEREVEILAKRLHLNLTADGVGSSGGESFQIEGDRLLCYSLFANLIKNAVEAAPRGGRLSIALEREAEGRALILIGNSGAVPISLRERFFDKFSTAGKAGGTGIGTYSARLIAQAQGGSVEMATSDADDETWLRVRLPMPRG